jgi:hypothetical protein
MQTLDLPSQSTLFLPLFSAGDALEDAAQYLAE